MNYRTAYIRRSRKGLRLKKRVAAVAVLGIAAAAAALLAPQWHAPLLQQIAHAGAAGERTAPGMVRISDIVDSSGTRRIYPYSVVAGGVGSRAELKNIIQSDKVVAAHYASFQVDKAQVTTVAKPRAAYVSYRKGDQVYWTAKKVMLAQGETVLSDGHNEIRGRCGNRISDTARLPVEAKAPTEDEMDSSVEAAADGKLNVAYGYNGEGGGQSHQLLSFANGAGMLAVSGGDAGRSVSPFGGMPAGGYPSALYSSPTALATATGSNAAVGDPGKSTTGTVVTTPVATDTSAVTDAPTVAATGSGSTTETPHTSDTSVAVSAPSTETGTSGGSTTETAATGSTPADAVELPELLADTAQPDTKVEVKTPTVPETLLWPDDLPTVPANPADTTAEAPEPATLWLSGVGFAALLLLRRRRPQR